MDISKYLELLLSEGQSHNKLISSKVCYWAFMIIWDMTNMYCRASTFKLTPRPILDINDLLLVKMLSVSLVLILLLHRNCGIYSLHPITFSDTIGRQHKEGHISFQALFKMELVIVLRVPHCTLSFKTSTEDRLKIILH